jgi:hypothetical protein
MRGSDGLNSQNFLINFGVSKDAAHFYLLRRNRSVRFGFSVATVLLGSSEDPVSFNTTVDGAWVCPFKGRCLPY